MRIVHNDEVCEVSADGFWSLRMDTGFDRFIAEGDKQIWSLLSEAEEPAGADGAVAMRRHTKLNFKENPVPSWLRGALGGGSDFSFKVTAHFYPTLYDEAHPYAYSTAFPVLADAISVVGKQWALAAGPNRCRLVSRVEVSQGGVVNPLTVAGTILAAGPAGAPVLASVYGEWIADYFLGVATYPLPYSLGSALAYLFPEHVQAYYDAVLEPPFLAGAAHLKSISAAAPDAVIGAIVVGFDLALGAGFAAYALAAHAKVAVALAAVGAAAVYKKRQPAKIA